MFTLSQFGEIRGAHLHFYNREPNQISYIRQEEDVYVPARAVSHFTDGYTGV